jgi:hypothetical protein
LPQGRKVEIHESRAWLPQGEPTFHMTGRIEWTFDSTFQQAVYELMEFRWRAKICPQCNKYFVADKTAKKYCSTNCVRGKGETKSLDYYHRVGKHRRMERRERNRKEEL